MNEWMMEAGETLIIKEYKTWYELSNILYKGGRKYLYQNLANIVTTVKHMKVTLKGKEQTGFSWWKEVYHFISIRKTYNFRESFFLWDVALAKKYIFSLFKKYSFFVFLSILNKIKSKRLQTLVRSNPQRHPIDSSPPVSHLWAVPLNSRQKQLWRDRALETGRKW